MIPDQSTLCRRDTVRVWSAHAAGSPSVLDRVAEHAVAADRFAREIVRFLKVVGGALAAAERQLVGRQAITALPFPHSEDSWYTGANY